MLAESPPAEYDLQALMASTQTGETTDIMEREDPYQSFRQVVQFFSVYVTMVVFASGIFGNFISVIIFVRLRKTDAVTSTYLAPMAVCDLINICIGMTTWLVQAVPVFSGGRLHVPEAVSDEHCKARVYLSLATGLMSTWTLVIFCAERCLAIWLPLKVGVMVTTSRRRYALVGLFLASLILGGAAIPPFKLYDQTLCAPIPNTVVEVTLMTLVNFGIYLAIPIVGLTVLNLLLICGLGHQDDNLSGLSSAKRRANDLKIVRNLLLISSIYIVTMTPFCVLGTIQITRNIIGWNDVTLEYQNMFNQMVELAYIFHFTNFSSNYLIYAMSLDFYRRELRKLLFCNVRLASLSRVILRPTQNIET